MAEVSQNANGKWKIVDIKHDDIAPSDVTIPATFTYRNKEVHLNITTTPQTVETEWVTQLGVKLNIDAVDRKYKKVTRKEDDGWKTYEAYDEFSDSDVIPFTETLAVNCTNRNPGSSTGNSTLSITSNTSWVITVEYSGSDTGWVHVPVTAGTGDTSQTITYDANTGTTQRSATIVIKTATKEERIQITQAGFVPTISITAATPIAATATGISYTVTSNVSKVKVKLGSTTKTTKTGTFTISENTATTPVSYVITASCTDYPTYTATTTVSQNAAGVELDASCSNTAPGSQQSTATLTIDSNVNWTISTNVDWITVATPLTGSGDATRNVTFAANSSTSQRTGKITVTGGGVTKEITITQAGVSASLTASCSNTTPGSQTSTANLTVTSNVSWTASSNVDWITITNPTGTGNATRTVTFATNSSTSQRTGKITVTGGGITREISITQDGATQAEFKVGTISTYDRTGGTKTLSITDTIGHNWEIVSYPSWLSTNNSLTGATSATITFTAQSNDNYPRTGKVVVRDLSASPIKDYNVTVAQNGNANIKITFKNYVTPADGEASYTWYAYGDIRRRDDGTVLNSWSLSKTFINSYTYTEILWERTGSNPVSPTTIIDLDITRLDFGNASRQTKEKFGRIEFHNNPEFSGEDVSWTGNSYDTMASDFMDFWTGETDSRNFTILNDGTFTIYPKEEPTPSISLTPTQEFSTTSYYAATNNYTAATVGVTNWTAEKDPNESWFSITKNSLTSLTLNIDENGTNQNRTGRFRLVSSDDSSVVSNWVSFFQPANPTAVPEGYSIQLFAFGDMTDPGATATTMPSAADYFKPYVSILSGDGQGHSVRMSDYLYGRGLDYQHISIDFPTTYVSSSKTITEGGSYEPTQDNPYELFLSGNQSYDTTGQTREFDITLSYTGSNQDYSPVSRTVHVTQPWEHIDPPVLDMNLYVDADYGGQAINVKEDNIIVKTVGSTRQIYFSLTTGSISVSGASWILSCVGNAVSSYFKEGSFGDGWFGDGYPESIDQACSEPNYWPGHTVECTLHLKDNVNEDFDIKIEGVKTGDPYIKTTLILHVKMN